MAACCACPWGYLTLTSRDCRCAHLVKLRHFDSKVQLQVEKRPLIPCERRLAKTEIWEFQELTFWACFGNRDYDRPFQYI